MKLGDRRREKKKRGQKWASGDLSFYVLKSQSLHIVNAYRHSAGSAESNCLNPLWRNLVGRQSIRDLIVYMDVAVAR